MSKVRVEALAPEFLAKAAELAERLGLSEESESEQCEEDFALQIGLNGLQLMEVGPGASGPVRVDFVEGVLAHRRQFGGGQGQMIAKAVGIQPGIRPRVLDATAGLGRDAFVLASLGCDVFLIERHAIVAALLEDALIRANQDEEVREISGRMQLLGGDAVELMQAWSGLPPEVVYLDPMFPHRDKSALVKKEMRLFRLLVGDDNDASALLEVAEGLASHRVVVKRPRKAPVLAGRKPTFCLEGKANRFDIYVKKSFRAV